MKKQTDKNKSRSTWISISGSLCVGFTLVSLWNQSIFYAEKFGVGMAILIGITIEAARLNSVDSIFSEKRGLKNPALYIYIIVALWCFTANAIAFNAKSSQKNGEKMADYGKLWQKVAKHRIDLIDKEIKKYKNENIQNVGLIGAGVAVGKIGAIKTKREAEISEFIDEKLKISNFQPSNITEYSRLVLLHGNREHISALNDISYTPDGENISILIFSISFADFWLYLQIIFAGLIELLIIFFAYRSKRSRQKVPQIARNEPQKKDTLPLFQEYKKDADCREWLNQKMANSGNHKRDKNGWIAISQLPKSKKEKFVEFRDFCNRHPELLEDKCN